MINVLAERHTVETHAYVFIASFCLMVIELVAGRIMAPYLGSSLYTWTSVIGVVLVGIALGNYTGGVLAERGASWRSVAFIYTFAGFAAALSHYTYAPTMDLIQALNLPMQAATVFFVVVGFFPVSFMLSLITPIVITLSLKSLEKTGTTVGKVYAVSTAASIAGTFAAGFLLIPLIGVKTIVLSVSAILILMGIVISRGGTTKELVVKATLLLLLASFLTPKFCEKETAYYCLNLEYNISERGEGYRFVLDRLTHSYVFDNPQTLEYDYEAVYAVLTEYMSERLGDRRPLRTLNIGGGGYTMPRYISTTYPDASVDVVEIDPMVTEANTEFFDLNPAGQIRTYNQDARMFFAHGADGNRYDVIFGDAFNDYSVPYHLTTVEFAELIRQQLTPDGIYALNTIDDLEDGRLMSSFVKTLSEVFPHVQVSSSGKDWLADGRNTFVILASQQPIDLAVWQTAADVAYQSYLTQPAPVLIENVKKLVPQEDVADLAARPGSVKLTDNYAPVDSMTAPLFKRH
ncbi:MAG: fused MFS/spermidine synthase [Patescibacteria group bacterium]